MSQIKATKTMVLENGSVITQDCYLDTNGLIITGNEPIVFDVPTLIENEYLIDEDGKWYTALPFAVMQMMLDSGEELDDEYGNGIAVYYD